MNLSTANVTGQPVTTFLGLSSFFNALSQSVAVGGLPHGAVGWSVFGASMLGGLFGMFGKAA